MHLPFVLCWEVVYSFLVYKVDVSVGPNKEEDHQHLKLFWLSWISNKGCREVALKG
jgi:hypothetical protein